MADHTATVAQVKDDCIARGINITGPCGAFNITGRVAWILRAEGWGLVAKTANQNGCSYPDHERYSVDALMLTDSTTIDCLINAETENIPAWQSTGAAPASSWRAPFDLDAGVIIPPNPNPNPDPTPIPPDIAKQLDDINKKLDALLVAFMNFEDLYNKGLAGIVSMPGWLGGNRPIILNPKS